MLGESSVDDRFSTGVRVGDRGHARDRANSSRSSRAGDVRCIRRGANQVAPRDRADVRDRDRASVSVQALERAPAWADNLRRRLRARRRGRRVLVRRLGVAASTMRRPKKVR